MAYMEKREFRSKFEEMYEITDDVQEIVKNSGVKDGFIIVHCNHTTAGILVTSFWDKRGHVDFMIEMDKLVPTRNDFLHTYDTPTDAAGHIKSMLVGTSQTLIVKDGKVLLGSSQGIFFAEFDGPRDRQFYVKVVSD